MEKPSVYFAYLDECDGGWDIGYFWNEFDALISCFRYHKKNLESLERAKIQSEKFSREIYKGAKILHIKELKKLRIKKLEIK